MESVNRYNFTTIFVISATTTTKLAETKYKWKTNEKIILNKKI